MSTVPSGAAILAAELYDLHRAGMVLVPQMAEVFADNDRALDPEFGYALMRTAGLGLGEEGAYPAWVGLRSILVDASRDMHRGLLAVADNLVATANDLSRVDGSIRTDFDALRNTRLKQMHEG